MLLRSQSPQRKSRQFRGARGGGGKGHGKNRVVVPSLDLPHKSSKRPRRKRSKRITIVSSPTSPVSAVTAVERSWAVPQQRSMRRRVVGAGAVLMTLVLLSFFYRVRLSSLIAVIVGFVGHIGGAM